MSEYKDSWNCVRNKCEWHKLYFIGFNLPSLNSAAVDWSRIDDKREIIRVVNHKHYFNITSFQLPWNVRCACLEGNWIGSKMEAFQSIRTLITYRVDFSSELHFSRVTTIDSNLWVVLVAKRYSQPSFELCVSLSCSVYKTDVLCEIYIITAARVWGTLHAR